MLRFGGTSVLLSGVLDAFQMEYSQYIGYDGKRFSINKQ